MTMNKSLILASLISLCAMSMHAQVSDNTVEDPNKRLVTIKPKFTDNFFVELHGGSYVSWGTNLTFSSFYRRIQPGGGLAVGKWITPYVAPRLQLMWGRNMGQLLSPKRNYRFSSGAVTGDAVLSLSNLMFRYNPDRWIDVQFIGGVGAEYTYGFDKKTWNVNNFYYNPEEKLYLSIHAGLGLKFRVSDAIDLGVESVVTFSNNSFDGGFLGNGNDGHMNVMATIGYRFKNSTGSHRLTFKGRRYMTSMHSKRSKIKKIEKDYISIVATDDKNRIQSTAYFTPDSISLDAEAKMVLKEAVDKYYEYNKTIKIYITVKDKAPADLSLFLLRAKEIREEMMNEYFVPGGHIVVERNPDVVKMMDPERVVVVVYVDDKGTTTSVQSSK